jgi:hypothetical protein
MKRRITLASVLSLSLFLPALAGIDLGSKKDEAKNPEIPKTVYTGEIVGLEETSIRIRPWSAKLPSRLTVTASAATRYFKQDRGGKGSLKPGELVLIVEDPRKLPRILRPKDETEEQRVARQEQEKALQREAALKPGSARGVLRLWTATGEKVSPEDDLTGRILLEGSRGYFEGNSQGGVNQPGKGTKHHVGIVKSAKPLVVKIGEDERQFNTYDETVWVTHSSIKPEELRKDKTILVHSPTEPGADGTIQALLIAVCPEPERSPKQQRKLIIRDQGGKKK